jgi:hypothetical protein
MENRAGCVANLRGGVSNLNTSFFPVSDADFSVWVGRFEAAFMPKWHSWGFTQADANALSQAIAGWQTAVKTRSMEASFARSLAETVVLGVINQLLSYSSPSTEDWAALGFDSSPEESRIHVSSPALHFNWSGSNTTEISWNTTIHPVWNSILIQGRTTGGQWEDVVTLPTASTPYSAQTSHEQFRACWIASNGTRGPWSAIGAQARQAA